MSTPLKICLYFVLVLITGALLAPFLFLAGHHSGIDFLQKIDFHRYFDRSMLIAAVIWFWPIARTFDIQSIAEFNLFGSGRNNQGWNYLLGGFFIALIPIWILGMVGVSTHVFEWRSHLNDFSALFKIVTQGIIAAIGAALLEELFFRGAMLGLVQKATSKNTALLFVSFLFAIVHFLKPPAAHLLESNIHWYSGFVVLPEIFWQFSNPLLLASGLTILFGVGLILGFARQKTISLLPCFGLHAGWIFGLKSFSGFTRHVVIVDANQQKILAGLPWYGENIMIGFAPLIALLVTGCFVYLWLSFSEKGNNAKHVSCLA